MSTGTHKVMGFQDQFFLIANFHNFIAFASVDPVGGTSLYLPLHAIMTIGQMPGT
jgi:hypothetical protein